MTFTIPAFVLWLFNVPLLKPKTRKIKAISDEPRFTTDLRANLSTFKERYEKILKERPVDWNDVAGKNGYIRTRKVYYNTSKSSFKMSMRNSHCLVRCAQ